MNKLLLLLCMVLVIVGGVFFVLNEKNTLLKEQVSALEKQNETLVDSISQLENKIEELNDALIEAITLGGDVQKFIGGFPYSLKQTVSSSGTSFVLTSLTLPQNDYPIQDGDLSDTFYVTLEPGDKNRQEFASCTTATQNSDGSATLSGCTRGLAPISPYTASSTLQFAHSGGSKLIFSNPPQLYDQAAFKGNDETILGLWEFGGLLPTSSTTATNSNQFANKNYVDNVVAQGAATSTQDNGGIVELATQQEMASSTDSTNTDKPRVIVTWYATSSPYTAGMWLPVTDKDGKLNQTFWRLSDPFAFTNTLSVTGLTTLVNASSSLFSVDNTLYVGNNGTTTIKGGSTASSTFNGHVDVKGTTGTSTFEGNVEIKGFASTTAFLKRYHRATNSSSLGTSDEQSTSVTATCSAGTEVMGGGFSGLPSPTANSAYEILTNGPSGNGWNTNVACNDADGTSACASGTLAVYAICADLNI